MTAAPAIAVPVRDEHGEVTVDCLFPPRSLIRQIHEEHVVGLFYGQRALCIGAADPLNYAATVLHSSGRDTPFRRLARTAELLEMVIFGSRAAATAAVRSVAVAHRRVSGRLPVAVGRYAQGTPYTAADPERLLWTLAVLADSAMCFYELFVRPLEDHEHESLWCDYRRFGELFGLDPTYGPTNYQTFREWWRDTLDRRTELTCEGKKTGYAIAFEIPMPIFARRVHNVLMKGTLPEVIRHDYGIVYTPDDHARFERASGYIRRLRRRLPRRMATGSNTYYFRYVANAERRRIRLGRPTPRLTLPQRHCASSISHADSDFADNLA